MGSEALANRKDGDEGQDRGADDTGGPMSHGQDLAFMFHGVSLSSSFWLPYTPLSQISVKIRTALDSKANANEIAMLFLWKRNAALVPGIFTLLIEAMSAATSEQ